MSTAPALGTPEYTNYLVDQGKTLGLNLEQYRVPPATAPTTTSQTTTSPSLQYPTNSPTYGNTSNAAATVSGADKYFADLQQMIKDQEAQQLEQQKIYADSQKTLLGKLSSSLTSPTEARQQALDTTGIIPKEYFADQKARIAEIDTLNQEYNATVAARDQQIAGSRDKLGSNNFINNQIAQIERNAAPKLNQLSANINSKAAVMKALQGNFAEAQNFVNQAVQDAVADNKFKYDLFSTMYEVNKDTFERMDSVYADSFKNSLTLAKMQYDQALDEKSKIGQLMLSYPTAGISLSDSFDMAIQKAGVASLVSGGGFSGGGTSGGTSGGTTSGYKFTSTQLNKGANLSGLTLDAFKALPGEVQNFYVNMTNTQASQISDALAKVKSGEVSASEAKAEIDSLNLPQSVKDYLKKQIDSATPTTSSQSSGFLSNFGNPLEGGFFKNVWEEIKYLTGNK